MKFPMTVQQVFVKARDHLLKQNTKSVSDDDPDYSMYHGADGRKCAVGIFIPKGKAKDVEGILVSDREVRDVLNIQATPGVVRLLEDLQKLHDQAPPESWASRLHRLAQKHGLEPKGKKR